MRPSDLSAAVPDEMQELSAARQTWHMGRHGDRMYWVYTPVGYRAGTAVPVIMVLHGCMQPFSTHPWAIAYDTHMNRLAETHQFLVVYPHEFAPPDVSPVSCWNFFLPENQHRDEGEPASLAGIVQDMLKNTARWTIDPQRIYVAGISSGGGATANLGATYPDLFAAIAVHSGGEYGYPLPFSQSPLSEVEILAGEVGHMLLDKAQIPPGPDPVEQGEKAFQAMGPFARVVSTIVFHGTADHVSDPINGDQVTQQWITTNHLASPAAFTATFEHPSSTTEHPAGPHGERPYTVSTWQDADGRDVVTYYKVDGMDHAWSGGTPGSIFTDPLGPDASQAMYDFFMAHPKQGGEKMTESRSTEPMPDHLLDAVRTSQDMTVDATKRLVDALQSVRASMAIQAPDLPNLPKPEELLANVYNFTERLLDSHRKFAEGMLEATRPLRSAPEGPAAEKGS